MSMDCVIIKSMYHYRNILLSLEINFIIFFQFQFSTIEQASVVIITKHKS